MLVYNYDYNGVFLSATEADESPLERGVYHVPAYATTIEPPVELFGKVRMFIEGKWCNLDVTTEGNPPAVVNVPETPEMIKARLADAVQKHLDSTAWSFGYDGILSAVSYAEEGSVPKFQEEGRKFRAWRSAVWAKCYDVLQQVERRERNIPTVNELIEELPMLESAASGWLPNAETGIPEVVVGMSVEAQPVWDEATSTWITPVVEPAVVVVEEPVAPAPTNKITSFMGMIWDTLTSSWKEPAPIAPFAEAERPPVPAQPTEIPPPPPAP